MSKRYIDTQIFEDDFIMSLSKDGKLMFSYFIANCDHAGILKLNKAISGLLMGFDTENALKELSARVKEIKPGVYFMPSFLKFQYPNFPHSKVLQQVSAIKILENLGLFSDGALVEPNIFTQNLPKISPKVTQKKEAVKTDFNHWITDFIESEKLTELQNKKFSLTYEQCLNLETKYIAQSIKDKLIACTIKPSYTAKITSLSRLLQNWLNNPEHLKQIGIKPRGGALVKSQELFESLEYQQLTD